MSKPLPTRIELDTAILSNIVSAILAELGAPSTKKSACLNIAARQIAGVKHNWGFLTGSKTPIVAQGLAAPDAGFNQPDYVIAGAALALKDHPLTPPTLAEALAPLVAGIYINELPAAIEVFKTTEEVYNDLLHNRGEIIGFVASQAHRSEQLTFETNLVLKHLGDVARENRPLADIVADKISQSSPETESVTAPGTSDHDLGATAKGQRPWTEILAEKIEHLSPKAGSVTPFAAPDRLYPKLDFSVPDFIAFMSKDDRVDPAVLDFMNKNAESIGAAIQEGKETPAGWQRFAKAAADLRKTGRDVEHMLVFFSETCAPVHARDLVEHVKQSW